MIIHITEHGRAWPAEEIAALGEVFTTDAPRHDPVKMMRTLRRALRSRGFRILSLWSEGLPVTDLYAQVKHDVPAVTGESVMDWQISALSDRCKVDTPTSRDLINEALYAVGAEPRRAAMRERWQRARARCAAAINARRGAQ